MSCEVEPSHSFQCIGGHANLSIGEITPKWADSNPVGTKSARPLRRQTSLSRFFAPKKDDPPANAGRLINQHPSSDEFNSDMDTSAILEDITMVDVSAVSPVVTPSKVPTNPFRITIPPPESVDEDFQTPPTSPLLGKSKNVHSSVIGDEMQSFDNPNDEAYFRQKYDLVHLPEPSFSGRKRSFPEPTKPSVPRKFSRDGLDNKFPRLYNVKYMSPVITPITREEERPGFPVFPADDRKPFLHKQDLNRSFDSVTSAATSTRTASPAWRSPNVSFTTDSAATSFCSSADASEITETVTIEQPILKKGHNMTLRRSTSACTNYESDKAMAPPTYVACETIDQYLAAHLFSETPFGSLPFQIRFSQTQSANLFSFFELS